MDERPDWIELLESVRRAKSSQDVLDFFARLDDLESDAQWRVLSVGFDRLEEFEYPDFENALVEQSIRFGDFVGHLVHSRLRRWVNNDIPLRRDRVLNRLIAVISTDELNRCHNAIWSAIAIGYRSPDLERQLNHIVEKSPDEETQLNAMWALVWLGCPNPELIVRTIGFLRRENLPELALRCAAKLLSAPNGHYLIPYVYRCFARFMETIKPGESDGEQVHQCINILYLMAQVAEEYPDAAAGVWSSLALRGDKLYNLLSVWSGIVESINDPNIPGYFLQYLEPDDPEQYRQSNFGSPHFHPYLRLIALNRPRHLEGAPHSLNRLSEERRAKVSEALRSDATVNSENPGLGASELSLLKEHVWEVILRLELPCIRAWLVEALNETGPFAAADVCRIAGHLRVEEAVPKLGDWVRQEGWDIKEGLRLGLGLAVLQALGNIGTQAALTTLMESRVSFAPRNGEAGIAATTPRDYVDAVVDTTLTLRDVEPIIAHLERNLAPDRERYSLACAGALERVCYIAPELVEPVRERLIALLRRDDWRSSEQYGFLISAIGFLESDERTADLLLKVASEGKEADQLKALESLARWQKLDQHDDLLTYVGLERTANGDQWQKVGRLDYRRAFIVGLLYRFKPAAFEGAICEIIRTGNYQIAIQAFQQLYHSHISPEVIEALVYRIHERNQNYRAETDCLGVLCRVAPQRFLNEMRTEIVGFWHQAARLAVVSCYEDIAADPLNSDLQNEIVMGLQVLICDPSFEVRRPAARALGRINSPSLGGLVEELCSSDDTEKNRFGVEASMWLSNEEAFQDIRQRAQCHRENVVRRTAEAAVLDRTREAEAQDYVHRVLCAPAEELLPVWRYAQALRTVGDDDILRQIREAIHDLSAQPNKRSFLESLYKEVERGWKDIQKNRAKSFAD